MPTLRQIIRRITTGRGYNDETDRAITESLSRKGPELGPGESYHDLGHTGLRNEKPVAPRYTVIQSAEFRSDLRRMVKRGADISELEDVVGILARGGLLPKQYRDHGLKGKYRGARECHIRPDWLLIYSYDKENLILREIRTGSHSDLFRT